jgi:hypothetical protein
MAEIVESESLRDKLKQKRVPVAEINKFLAYVRGEQQKEATKEPNKRPVTSNNDDMLYTMFIKWWSLGMVIDGVNIVITGRAMSMVTYQGYKNKVRATYPSAKFDIQLVREGDTFSVRKESGKVEYKHEIGDAFSEKPINGAYCVISIDGRDYFEGLNKKDYEEMKKGSKQSYLWDKWDSEFWLKSVIKRACKRHFYDVVKEIDENDNAEYGQRDLAGGELLASTEEQIKAAVNADEIMVIMGKLSVADRKACAKIAENRLVEIANGN